MSWSLDGRMYHNHSEYQAALQRKAAREASGYAGQARAELQRYQQRLRDQQQELERTQGDLARQRQIGEQMRQEVRGIEREQRNLASAQAAFEQQSNARLGELRSHMQGMDDQLAEAEQNHLAHVEATRQAFVQANEALQSGLANAEKQRREGEQRMMAAVQEVDQKVETDRRQRLNRQRDNLAQATEQIAMVEEVLGQLAGKLGPLNLEEEEHGLRIEMRSAEKLVKAGNAAAALSTAESAFNEARKLDYKSTRRRSELTATATAIANRIQSIGEVVKAEALDIYFKTEKAELIRHLSHLAGRLPQRYQQYSRMEDDLREDERILAKLEEEARGMVAMCPTLAEQVDERKKRVTELVRKVAKNYGGSASIESTLAEPNDLKSELIVNCTFSGGAKVRIEAGVDGGYHVDAAGHGTQDECSRRAAEFVGMLGAEADVTSRTLPHNPSELPEPALARKATSWRDVGSRLRDIGREL